jgi:hypothetical protein
MRRSGAIGLVGGLAAATGALLAPTIPQDPAYHRLAAARRWPGVPNALMWPLLTGYSGSAGLLAAAGIYGLAKLPELADAEVLSATRVAGGHTLKHLLAALAGYSVLRVLRHRHTV